jgi:acylphosphatase
MSHSDAPAGVHIKIIGRVQGVYYRASTVQEAAKLGLTGWVRNCDDGSVEAIAEGPRPKLEELIAWCREGPPGARVSRVEVEWRIAERGFHGFTVRR